jgi:hypothetical protein
MNRFGVVVASAAIGSCTLIAGCGGSPSLPGPTASSAGLLHQAALDRGSATAATLTIDGGATTVHITVGNVVGKLLTVVTPLGSGQRPILTAGPGGTVDLRFASAGAGGGPAAVDVVLARSVLWRLDLDGGATAESVDMRGGRVALVDFAAGASRESIDLPAGSGTQVVREVGGTSQLTVDVPSTVAARVDVHGGASSVELGTTTHTGIGGNQTFLDPGYATARDRLELDLQGGVSSVRVRKS